MFQLRHYLPPSSSLTQTAPGLVVTPSEFLPFQVAKDRSGDSKDNSPGSEEESDSNGTLTLSLMARDRHTNDSSHSSTAITGYTALLGQEKSGGGNQGLMKEVDGASYFFSDETQLLKRSTL